MKSTKTILAATLGFLLSVSAMARTMILTNTTPVYEEDRRGDLNEVVTFYEGTQIEVFDEVDYIRGFGDMTLVKRINGVRDMSSRYRRDMAREINRNSDRDYFWINANDIAPLRSRPVRVNPGPRHDRSRREVILDRRNGRYDSGTIREVCYETPRQRVVTMNEERRDRGGRNIVGGIIGTIGGQILGEVTGNDRLGDVVSAIGLGFAAVGAVQVASSQEVFYTDYEIDCRQYYTPDRRVYTFERNRQTCSTTRYYSTSWGGTHEYFETVCHGRQTSRFVTFERSREIYRY